MKGDIKKSSRYSKLIGAILGSIILLLSLVFGFWVSNLFKKGVIVLKK